MLAPKNNNNSTIDFVGGPFDGYLQRCSPSRERLPSDVVWLVSSDALRQIRMPHRVEQTFGGTLTSAALYGLDTSLAPSRYRHVGSISATSLQRLLQNLSQKQNG